ncbi:MAG: exodeoxyribonuclease VII small subunit [Lachnospiraceae bacterium]|nr:exodeoxyribonuclease VII small subunit [Lachnospiraceae bacterium]
MKKKETELKEKENNVSLEELFSQIEGVISGMEEEEVSLEDAFSLYQKGISLVKQCNEKIDRVEKEIQILNEAAGEEDNDEL